MGKIVSKLNLFNACRDPDTEPSKEEKKEEIKRPTYKVPKALHNKKSVATPLEVSSSEVQLDEDMQNFTQIGCFRNDDGYFSPEEIEYYQKLYADEKVNHKPLTSIKSVVGFFV